MNVMRRFLSTLRVHRRAAVTAVVVAVVVVVLVAVTAGVGISWAAGAAPSMTPDGPTVRVERDGLVLTMQVGPGPYFLRELLPVSVSLTNSSNRPVSVQGVVAGDAGINNCGSTFGIGESGGHAPTYEALNAGGMTCPGLGYDVAPGRTVSASDVLPLTASGRLALTALVRLNSVTAVGPNGPKSFGTDPFEGHEPQLQLMVDSNAPPQRTILLLRFGTRVYVIAPRPAETHLRYIYTASARGCWTSNFGWEPITTPIIDDQLCVGQSGTWTYAVGAPGYAIAGETVSGISP